jgi:mono/diheme cytochrome c family protein
MLKILLRWGAIAAACVVVILLLIQAIPYGRHHTNPPTRQEPAWDSQQTHDLVVDACYDCHSNRTSWPWYSNIAPVSWLVQRDVDGGRKKLNFTEWDRPQSEAGEIIEKVREGEMPPLQYRLLHPKARLSSAERQALVQGLEATLGHAEADHGENEKEE